MDWSFLGSKAKQATSRVQAKSPERALRICGSAAEARQEQHCTHADETSMVQQWQGLKAFRKLCITLTISLRSIAEWPKSAYGLLKTERTLNSFGEAVNGPNCQNFAEICRWVLPLLEVAEGARGCQAQGIFKLHLSGCEIHLPISGAP